MTSCDAILIGGGHNGLTAATLLARAGHRVVLLEAADTLGGAARTVEFAPGFRASGVAQIVNRIDPTVARTLGLDLAALSGPPLPTILPGLDAAAIVLRGGYGATVEGVSPDEAASFARLRDKLMTQAALLKRFMTRRPPQIGAIKAGDLAAFAGAGFAMLRQGRNETRDLMRMLLTNVYDTADEYLTDDRLKGFLAFDATLGAHLGPRSPTSLLGLHYRLTGAAGGVTGAHLLPQGGMGAIAAAFANAATRAGVTIRTGAKVARITASQGRVTGVVLEGGEALTAPLVVSGAHPQTVLGLLDPAEVETGFARALRGMRSKGNVAVLHLALAKTPQFSGVTAGDHAGRIVIAPTADHVETAFNPAKYGEFSPRPVMEVTLPSISDPTLAQSGCTLSALVQFAPYDLREGWASGKPRFLDAILEVLEDHAPGLRASVTAHDLLTPVDIEARYRMPGGHWHHGEMQPDQLLINRPVHAASGYATPIEGLWLASAGSHPGGGISGLPGYLAARAILKGGRR